MENPYKREEEFLKAYNPNDYERLSLTSDILIVSVSDVANSNYRKSDKKVMSILLVIRSDYHFKDKYSHISISFDEECTNMYTIGRRWTRWPFSGKYMNESIYKGVYKIKNKVKEEPVENFDISND